MPASAAPLRVALAEDEALFREALASLLTSAGVSVTATCASADELISRIRQETPDIVILDIRLQPGHSDEGIRAAAVIRQEFPNVGILILSDYAETPYASALMDVGTTSIGYQLKQRVTGIELVDKLKRIANGECALDPEIVKVLMRRPKRRSHLDTLSPREREVLQLMTEGYRNGTIADKLCLSPRSIEKNVANIFMKLGMPKDDGDTHRRVLAVITWLRGR